MGTSPRYTGIYIMKFTVVGRRRGGRLPREPQPGRIENMRKKYSQDSGEPGRGGVCEFYILPGYRGRRKEEGGWGGGALHLAGRRIRVSASRLRWNKDANYCLARAPGNDPTPPTGTERRKPEGSLLFRVWNEVRRMYQACLRGRKMFEMENKILNTSHHFLNICFELHVCTLYFFLFFFLYWDKFNFFCYWIYLRCRQCGFAIVKNWRVADLSREGLIWMWRCGRRGECELSFLRRNIGLNCICMYVYVLYLSVLR